jgi:hypothetical protein
MGVVPALALLALLQGSASDSAYADAPTRALVARARERHAAQDTLVHDYQAKLITRVDASLGRSRFARIFPLIASEQMARVRWSRPHDLRVEIIGRRTRILFPDADADVGFDSPWFFPRGVGDSIRLFGEGLPERAALHPLAPGAQAFYRYAILDSATVRLPARTIETATLDVRPRRSAPALIAGRLTVDRETGEVIRLTFLFLGEFLWVSSEEQGKDSARAARGNRAANQALRLEADIEYALYEERYWMPFRQIVKLEAQDHWVTGVVIPVRIVTRFQDYEINAGVPVRFALELADTADSRTERNWQGDSDRVVRAGRSGEGGRWELERPPKSVLESYRGWEDSLTLDAQPGDERRLREMGDELGRLAEDLPTGMTGLGSPGFVRWGEMLRFNRIQGLAIGGTWSARPHVPFTTVFFRGQFGLADTRVLGSVTAERDAPGGLWDLSLFHSLRDVDPFSSGTSMANSFNALFAGHDDADYVLATGARLGLRKRLGRRWEWQGRIGVERQASVAADAESALHDVFFGDGLFPPNPPVRSGAWGSAGMVLDRVGVRGSLRVGADALGGGRDDLAAGRVWTEMRLVLSPFRATVLGGLVSRDDVPQLLLRAGGPRTVRGFDFGARAGEVMWAVQLEAAVPRSGALKPFVFADVGYAGPRNSVTTTSPLIGVGGGLSVFLLITEFRIEVSKSVGAFNQGDARVDLLFRPAR